MTDKKPYLASLKGRGLDGTGVTDNVARQMVLAKGRRYMAVVELEVHTIHDKPEQMIADLNVDQFWPIVDDTQLDDHLRGIAALLHTRRGDDGDDHLEFDGPAPKVADIIAGGVRFTPHPFLPVDVADDNPICDVCGQLESAGVHRTGEKDHDEPGDEADEPDDEPLDLDAADPAYDADNDPAA